MSEPMSETQIVAAKFSDLTDHLLNEEGRAAICQILPRFIAGVMSSAPADTHEQGLSALCDDVRRGIVEFSRFLGKGETRQ
jgi:hypothetical protein